MFFLASLPNENNKTDVFLAKAPALSDSFLSYHIFDGTNINSALYSLNMAPLKTGIKKRLEMLENTDEWSAKKK